MAHHTRDQTCNFITRERALDAHGMGAVDGRLDPAHCTAGIHHTSQTSWDCSNTAWSDVSLSPNKPRQLWLQHIVHVAHNN